MSLLSHNKSLGNVLKFIEFFSKTTDILNSCNDLVNGGYYCFVVESVAYFP